MSIIKDALHILSNRYEYGPLEKTMSLLKPLNNTSLLTSRGNGHALQYTESWVWDYYEQPVISNY